MINSPQAVYREFRDSLGAPWRVWEVVPISQQRSTQDRRDRTPEPATAPGRARDEQRARNDVRRITWNEGWLLFESEATKKRLVPIPRDWQKSSERELQAMCDLASAIENSRP